MASLGGPALVAPAAAMNVALYRMGDAAAAGDIAVVVVAAHVSEAGPGTPATATVDCTVRNIGSTPLSVSTLPALVLEDAALPSAEALAAIRTRPEARPETLAPKAAITLSLDFEPPGAHPDLGGWRLRVGGPWGPRILLRRSDAQAKPSA